MLTPISLSTPFSILYRIEWVVTTVGALNSAPGRLFQYPVSDRMGCNRKAVDHKAPLWESFSILYRIEWVVTRSRIRYMPSPFPSFSILYRIEWVVTLYRPWGRYSAHRFQYPVSDRMGCNLAAVFLTLRFGRAFSILYRIEWVVTQVLL